MPKHILEDLGRSADEVASALRYNGIQGARNTVRALNPVVRYVQMQVGEIQSIQVIDHKLSICFLDGREAEEQLPQAVRQFLDAFNRGHYSDLHLPSEIA
jgi:hypothetical protein